MNEAIESVKADPLFYASSVRRLIVLALAIYFLKKQAIL